MAVQSALMEISRRFIGKVALVTGAGQGIGRATALRLAREGAAVGILDRNPQTTSETVSIIKGIGARSLGLIADVSDTEAVAEQVQTLREEFGSVDVLVNNAGFDRPGAFLKIGPRGFQGCLGRPSVGGDKLLPRVRAAHDWTGRTAGS